MRTQLARIKNHFANWRAWELNPIVVKELRQSVRSWSVTGMLLLFLAVLFCTAVVLLITQSFELQADHHVGANIFRVFAAILTGASLLFIPLYVGVRLASERADSNLDLLYITTLTPSRIIRGKFLCGAYMTLLFFSACMPFMAFTNLLRGVDLPTIGFILLCLFVIVCVAIQIAIFVACLPISKLFKVLLALIGIGCVLPSIGGLTFAFYTMMQSGVGSMMARKEFWIALAIIAGVALALTVLLYLLSVALISPLSANRAFPLRMYMTLLWFVGLGVAVYCVSKYNNFRPMFGWAIPALILLAFSLVVVVSNADSLSLRVRRAIPANPARRIAALLFYNGAAGGLIWVALLASATLGITHLVWLMTVDRGRGFAGLSIDDYDDFVNSIVPAVCYALSYALTAVWLQRKLLARRSARLAGVFTVLLPAILALAPNIVLFFANRLSLQQMEATQLGNVFNLFMVKDWEQRMAHTVFALCWLALAIVLNAGWFKRQWRAFRPLEKWVEKPPPVPEGVPPTVASGQIS